MTALPATAHRDRGQWPLVTLALAAIAGLVAAVPALQPHLVGARTAVAAGEVWRLVTAHLVHVSASHFAWDLAAFVVLGVLCERAGRARFAACLCGSALLIPAGLWLWQPSLSSYCGLSGIDSALFVLLTAGVLRRAAAARQPLEVVAASLLAAGFVVKVGYEFTTASTVFVAAVGVPVPLAHVIGAVVGLGFGVMPRGIASCSPTQRYHRALRGLMTNRCSSACVRLTALAALLTLLAVFACRPAWSPDGKRLLFHSRLADDRRGIALFDRGTGTAGLLFTPHGGKTAAVPLWLPDGKGAVIVWTDKNEDKQLSIAMLAIPPRGEVRTFRVPGGEHTTNNIVVPPVLVGRRLFFAGKGITRLDLDSGDVKQEEGVAGEQLVVTARGKGVCYISLKKGDDASWELGTVDPDTLQRCPIQKPPLDQRWEVMPLPAFTRDLARLALPAKSPGEPGGRAILVFRDGKLETVLPIEGDVEFGSVEWLPDGATLCASLCRLDVAEQRLQWSLLETTISGSVSRETPIVHAPHRGKDAGSSGLACQLALSPDGRTAALSTALLDKLDEDDHGLYLVDLAHKDRRVTKVPFPPATQELTLAGSDAMLGFAEHCTQGYTAANPLCLVTVTGGGSGAGMSKLLRSTTDLALMSRPPKPTELEEAKNRAVTLTEHRVATAALAVCVHKDNPVASLTVDQLAEIFGEKGVRRWSELSVPMSAEFDEIVAATPNPAAPGHEHFRELVLGLSRAAPTNRCLDGAPAVVEFVSKRPGAIGYVPLADVTDAVKIVPIAGKPGMAPCSASQASVADGSYPLARHLFLYSRTDSRPAVSGFLEWLSSAAGKKVIEQAGLLSVR